MIKILTGFGSVSCQKHTKAGKDIERFTRFSRMRVSINRGVPKVRIKSSISLPALKALYALVLFCSVVNKSKSCFSSFSSGSAAPVWIKISPSAS